MAAKTKKAKKGKKAKPSVRKSGAGKCRRRHPRALFLVAFALSVLFVIFAVITVRWYVEARLPAFGQDGVIRVYKNMSPDELAVQIDSVLHPLHPKSLSRAMERAKVYGNAYPGVYRITREHSARYLARALVNGWQNPVNLVISCPVRDIETLAGKISSQIMVSKEELVDAFTDGALLGKYDTAPIDFLGFVLPDTYQVYWNSSPEQILERLHKEYNRYWNAERTAKAAALELTPSQVSILASIVAEESNRPEEYPKIASVYLNRLRKGMKLQACPTIRFIYGYKIKRVLNEYLANPSPYNTYIYEGLPPSPICMPGKEHIEAVLNHTPMPYLYFCADSALNGKNVFSTTYAEHLRNASAYHKAVEAYRRSKKSVKAAEEIQTYETKFVE